MCDLCSTCTSECYCPRCPHRKGRLLGYPSEIQQCAVCGMDDDRECFNKECAINEHCMFSGEMYCQICVEQEHGLTLLTDALGMYCDDHEDEHKERMRAKVIKRVLSRRIYELSVPVLHKQEKPEEEQESERIREYPVRRYVGQISHRIYG
jgi:hypothetical protein